MYTHLQLQDQRKRQVTFDDDEVQDENVLIDRLQKEIQIELKVELADNQELQISQKIERVQSFYRSNCLRSLKNLNFLTKMQQFCLFEAKYLKNHKKNKLIPFLKWIINVLQLVSTQLKNNCFIQNFYFIYANQEYEAKSYSESIVLSRKALVEALSKPESIRDLASGLPALISKIYFLLSKSYLKLLHFQEAIVECQNSLRFKTFYGIEDEQTKKLRKYMQNIRTQIKHEQLANPKKQQEEVQQSKKRQQPVRLQSYYLPKRPHFSYNREFDLKISQIKKYQKLRREFNSPHSPRNSPLFITKNPTQLPLKAPRPKKSLARQPSVKLSAQDRELVNSCTSKELQSLIPVEQIRKRLKKTVAIRQDHLFERQVPQIKPKEANRQLCNIDLQEERSVKKVNIVQHINQVLQLSDDNNLYCEQHSIISKSSDPNNPSQDFAIQLGTQSIIQHFKSSLLNLKAVLVRFPCSTTVYKAQINTHQDSIFIKIKYHTSTKLFQQMRTQIVAGRHPRYKEFSRILKAEKNKQFQFLIKNLIQPLKIELKPRQLYLLRHPYKIQPISFENKGREWRFSAAGIQAETKSGFSKSLKAFIRGIESDIIEPCSICKQFLREVLSLQFLSQKFITTLLISAISKDSCLTIKRFLCKALPTKSNLFSTLLFNKFRNIRKQLEILNTQEQSFNKCRFSQFEGGKLNVISLLYFRTKVIALQSLRLVFKHDRVIKLSGSAHKKFSIYYLGGVCAGYFFTTRFQHFPITCLIASNIIENYKFKFLRKQSIPFRRSSDSDSFSCLCFQTLMLTSRQVPLQGIIKAHKQMISSKEGKFWQAELLSLQSKFGRLRMLVLNRGNSKSRSGKILFSQEDLKKIESSDVLNWNYKQIRPFNIRKLCVEVEENRYYLNCLRRIVQRSHATLCPYRPVDHLVYQSALIINKALAVLTVRFQPATQNYTILLYFSHYQETYFQRLKLSQQLDWKRSQFQSATLQLRVEAQTIQLNYLLHRQTLHNSEGAQFQLIAVFQPSQLVNNLKFKSSIQLSEAYNYNVLISISNQTTFSRTVSRYNLEPLLIAFLQNASTHFRKAELKAATLKVIDLAQELLLSGKAEQAIPGGVRYQMFERVKDSILDYNNFIQCKYQTLGRQKFQAVPKQMQIFFKSNRKIGTEGTYLRNCENNQALFKKGLLIFNQICFLTLFYNHIQKRVSIMVELVGKKNMKVLRIPQSFIQDRIEFWHFFTEHMSKEAGRRLFLRISAAISQFI